MYFPRREVVLYGAHGGAGVTTLYALLRPAWDLGSMQGLPDPGEPVVHPNGRPLLVVTRDTVPAARRAMDAVTAITQAGEHIAALIIVSDGAGPEPREAKARFRLLEGRLGGVVRMPYVPALRVVDDPTAVELPRKARRALDEIRAAVDAPAWTS